MQLSTYLNDLLYRYDCLTIPEFGSFISQHVPAQIDKSDNTFYPPKKTIVFNKEITGNDGVLASYIAEVESISFEEAVKRIAAQTAYFNATLNKGETVHFATIGYLKPTANGVSFEALKTSNFLPESFGLSAFGLKTLNNDSASATIPIKKQVANGRSYLKYAAVAVLGLSLAAFASNYYLTAVENHNKLAQEQAEKHIESKIEEATFVINKPLSSLVLSVTKQTGNFHIIAGAFRVKENADNAVVELKNQGFNARAIGINTYGLHEVVYDSYDTRKDALQNLNAIRKTHNPEAWLLVKKL